MIWKTLLIEDEVLAKNRLERLLRPHVGLIHIAGQATNGRDAIEVIDQERPDLIFLDIQMPEYDGFEVLARISHQPLVIFTTAFDQYALRAFESHTVDYLLKPIDPTRLARAIDKLRRFNPEEEQGFRENLLALVARVKGGNVERIQVRLGNCIRFLDPKEICFFQALDKYVEVHTVTESFLVDKTLVALERQVPQNLFVRIHRSALVNWDFLGEVKREVGGGYRVRIKNEAGSELPLSRSGKANLGLS